MSTNPPTPHVIVYFLSNPISTLYEPILYSLMILGFKASHVPGPGVRQDILVASSWQTCFSFMTINLSLVLHFSQGPRRTDTTTGGPTPPPEGGHHHRKTEDYHCTRPRPGGQARSQAAVGGVAARNIMERPRYIWKQIVRGWK